VRRAENLTTFMYRLSKNLGASTSWSPNGLSRPVVGLLYLLRSSETSEQTNYAVYKRKSRLSQEQLRLSCSSIPSPFLIVFVRVAIFIISCDKRFCSLLIEVSAQCYQPSGCNCFRSLSSLNLCPPRFCFRDGNMVIGRRPVSAVCGMLQSSLVTQL
jgi:hypothetical protein